MKCPHLSAASNQKICRLMVEQGLEEGLDDFDIRHYCRGNPNHCYFYRECRVQKPAMEQSKDSKPEKLQVVLFDELSNLKLGEAEISVNLDESHPLHFKLAKKGLRHKVKRILVKPEVLATSKAK